MSNFSVANAVDTTDAGDHIPQVWSLETVATYKKNLVMAALVTVLKHQGKKGDIINIPEPARGSAAQKSAATVVTPIAFTDTNQVVNLNQHYYYARLIEDLTELQALPSLRQFFTNDAGYALATQIDTGVAGLAATWGGGTAYSKAVIGSDGSTAWSQAGSGNGAAIADAGIRRVIQTLDDNNVPMRDRYLVVPPVEKRKLLGETRFTEQAFVGEAGMSNSIRNGLVGDLYGVELYVSTNVATTEANDSTAYRAALLFQKEALLLAEQQSPRVQTQYMLEALGTLLVADAVWGVKTIRGHTTDGDGCKAIIVPNS
jgi:hypothetical protein